MPTTNSRNLEFTNVGINVTIRVTYNVVFSQLERHLAQHGLRFVESIRVIGEDAGTATDQTLLPNNGFPSEFIPVMSVPAGQPILRNRTITVPRSNLREDIDNVSEIRCQITIRPLGLPTTITAYTDQESVAILVLEQPN